MKTFYVSDSFTLSFKDFQNDPTAWHYPGPFNQDVSWAPGQKVDVEVLGAECAHIVYANPSVPLGTAMDVYLGLYNINVAPGNPAVPVQNYRLKFLTEDGNEMAEAVLVNSITRIGLGLLSPVSRRVLAQPLRIGGVAPNISGAVYQIGAVMRFFGDHNALDTVPMEYEYFVQGRVTTPSPPPSPPPPSVDEIVMMTPDGVFSWPVRRV